MINKQSFGAFIREKRIENGLTQKGLAEMLFISESAVSKWEMGKSYPDITLVPELCKALNVSEKELITGATDTEYRNMIREARLYRRVSETFFWGFTIAYAAAMVICLICDLAVFHGLTFSVVVFGSLLVAFSFIPTWIRFTKQHKLAMFTGTTYLSMLILFAICCIRYHGNWFGIAAAGVLLGYLVVFGPLLLKRYLPEKSRMFLPLISFCADEAGLLLLLAVIRMTVDYPMGKAMLVALYAFIPFVTIGSFHLTGLNRYLKAAFDLVISGAVLFGLYGVLNILFGGINPQDLRVDFTDWAHCVNGNVRMLTFLVMICIALILAAAGIIRMKKKSR